MASFRKSIFAKFAVYASFNWLLILALAATNMLCLRAADHNTAALAGTWSDGAMVLGEIDYNLAAFRVAEVSRELASTDMQRQLAETSAVSERDAINTLTQDYETRLGSQTPHEFQNFIAAWQGYQTAHESWVSAGFTPDAARMDSPGGILEGDYQATAQTIAHVIAIHQDEAAARARNVTRIGQLSDVTVFGIALAALTFSLLIMLRARVSLIRPLTSITRAMAELAAGNREAAIPARDRQDEIGEMAASCEIFRLNVVALDQAHDAARAAEEQAQLLARHDALTGLPNRRVFTANLEKALERANRRLGMYSVLLIDLDEFKKINDLQGHHIGDVVLCEIARRLEANLRKTDTASRLGGDEFAVITEGEHDPHEHQEHARRLATRLLKLIQEPILVGDSRIEMAASIGIASALFGLSDVSSILRAADIAMYRAKQSGRCTFRFFEQSMDDEMREREILERELIAALRAGEIKPHFQPLVDITAHRIRGFEALARWPHATRGFVPPDEFIPILEQLGLIAELSATMLRQACRAALDWPADICVAVNFSPTELKDQNLPARILQILHEEGLSPQRLEVEITESALVSDLEGAKTILRALQKQGVTICLDDFGTGYSSLYHLRELKFDKVKIDRSFVQAMQTSEDSEKIIDAVLSLTNSLQLPAVAEGIETPAILKLLQNKGCEFGQGYYFSKPIPAAATLALLSSQDANTQPLPVT